MTKELEIADGVTVDHGKSAMVSALQWAMAQIPVVAKSNRLEPDWKKYSNQED